MIKRGKIEMLGDFMTGLNAMIDASSQMVHHRGSPKWIAVRDLLNIIKDTVSKTATRGMNNG